MITWAKDPKEFTTNRSRSFPPNDFFASEKTFSFVITAMQGKAIPMRKNAIDGRLGDTDPIPDIDAMAATTPPAITRAAPDSCENEYLNISHAQFG